jgi:hypothetical protein
MTSRKTPQNTKQGPPKATDAQLAQRISTVHTMLVQGKSRPVILAYAADHWRHSTMTTHLSENSLLGPKSRLP